MSILAFALLLAALGGEGPTDSLVTATDTGVAVDASDSFVFGMRWRRPIIDMGFQRKVSVARGRAAVSRRHHIAVVSTAEGVVRAIRVRDGEVAWTYDYGEPLVGLTALVSTPTGERALVTSGKGQLLALSVRDGSLTWQAEVSGAMAAEPTELGDTIVVTTSRNRVYRIHATTGEVLWSQGRPPAAKLSIAGHSRALVEGDRIYAAFSDGYVECYQASDGVRLWSRPLSLRRSDFSDADADPVLMNGVLVVASYADGIYGLRPDTGQVVWNRSAPAVAALAPSGELVVALSADGWAFGLSPTDGTMHFRSRFPAAPVTRPAVQDGLIAFAAGDLGLVVLDGKSGRPVQVSRLGERFSSEPVWRGRDLLLISERGYLYAYGLGAPSRVQ